MLDRQKIFDTVVPLLLDQGGRAMAMRHGTLGCAYRGKGGAKCAVGHLIPDENYSSAMEGNSASNEDVYPHIDPIFGNPYGGDFPFLNTMQQCLHDNLYDWSIASFREAAERFAKTYSLKVDVNLFN